MAGTLLRLGLLQTLPADRPGDDAGPTLRRAVSILETSRGPDDPEIARALHALAFWQLRREEFDAAEAELARAVAIREKAFGPESPKLADLLDDLGDLHAIQVSPFDLEAIEAEFRGQPERQTDSQQHRKKAEAAYGRSLAIREKVLQPDDPDIAESLLNLGRLFIQVEEPTRAEPYLVRWLALPAAAKGAAGEKEATVLMMLAVSAAFRKDYAEAERRLVGAQELFAKTSGPASEETSGVLSLRIDLALDAGWFDDADCLIRQAMDIQARLLGARDLLVVAARSLLAGSDQDHAEDRKGLRHWNRWKRLARQARQEPGHERLAEILDQSADLIRRTSRAMPGPSEDDLAFLKKVGAVSGSTDLDALARMSGLVDLNLDDEGLAHVARLYALETLRPSRSVSDAGLAHLKDLVHLRELSLDGTRITDAGLAQLAGLIDLEELDLSDTRVGDSGLAQLRRLTRLRTLRVASTKVTDAGLVSLEGLKTLSRLDLTFTKVTDAGLERLRRALPELEIRGESGELYPDSRRPNLEPASAPLPIAPPPLIQPADASLSPASHKALESGTPQPDSPRTERRPANR